MAYTEQEVQSARYNIRRAAKALGSLRTDYSGRCMSGEICYGVVTTNPEGVLACVNLPGYRKDSMGMNTILYWPWVTGEYEEEEDVEE